MAKQPLPSGAWPSPITADAVAGAALRLGRVQVSDDAVYWSEGRPAEGGRSIIMRWSEANGVEEILPSPYSARSRVHEYGGGEFLIAGGRLYFVNDADQDVYEAEALIGGSGQAIRRLTEAPWTRFADFTFDATRNRLICVGETYDSKAEKLPQAALWSIDIGTGVANGRESTVLSGRDFYASPRLSVDGKKLAFLAWDLPNMPWDDAQLLVAEIARDGSIDQPIAIAGGGGSACFQPEWGGSGILFFVWDKSGSGQLFSWNAGAAPQQITHLDGDLSMPLWSLNAASYALLNQDRIYLAAVKEGEVEWGLLDIGSGEITVRDNGFSTVSTIASRGSLPAFCGMSDENPLSIVVDPIDETPSTGPFIVRRSASLAIEEGYVSKPERIKLPGSLGPVYGVFYPPSNPRFKGLDGDKPALIISLHGGPTTASARGLKPRTLYFTSRGFAWLDLDYSGSTGYGRAYRDRLKGAWGVADVNEAISAAAFLADKRAKRDGIFLTGGSAGGFTVLGAIAKASVFRGAVCYYGICDLIALQNTTHKFEQGYQATLLGTTLENGEDLYRERSAINQLEGIATPLMLFQGAEDQVVPKAQSIAIAEALDAKGVFVEYREFAGEGHGFRKAETIRECLESELAFYRNLLD